MCTIKATNFSSFYKNILTDLSKFQEKTKIENYAESTIKAIKEIFEKRTEIAHEKTEDSRSLLIRKVTKLSSEKGFVTGNNKGQIEGSIIQKTLLLQKAYLYAKDHDTLDDFFRDAFKSDPCFNGRIIALTEYVAKNQSGFSKEALEEKVVEGVSNKRINELLEQMYNLSDKINVPFTKVTFEKHLKENKEYESKFKILVESKKWNEIYNTAKMGFL